MREMLSLSLCCKRRRRRRRCVFRKSPSTKQNKVFWADTFEKFKIFHTRFWCVMCVLISIFDNGGYDTRAR